MRPRRRRLAVAAVAALPLLAYPLAVVAAGGPSFPGGREECARVATGEGQGELELVAAHLPSLPAAEELRARLVAAGFVEMQVEPDGCGWWKVTNDGIDTYAQGLSAAGEARRAGFGARLEVDPAP